MPNPNIEIGRKIGALLASNKAVSSVPSITIEVDQKQIVEAIKSAVDGAGDISREAVVLAAKSVAEEIGSGFGDTAKLISGALALVAKEVKAGASVQGLGALTAAISAHAQAVRSQGEGLAMIAKAIDSLALANRAEKTMEYDASGRITRVKVG